MREIFSNNEQRLRRNLEKLLKEDNLGGTVIKDADDDSVEAIFVQKDLGSAILNLRLKLVMISQLITLAEIDSTRDLSENEIIATLFQKMSSKSEKLQEVRNDVEDMLERAKDASDELEDEIDSLIEQLTACKKLVTRNIKDGVELLKSSYEEGMK